jgi:hypothetical protein
MPNLEEVKDQNKMKRKTKKMWGAISRVILKAAIEYGV